MAVHRVLYTWKIFEAAPDLCKVFFFWKTLLQKMKHKNRLQNLTKTAKWYHDFGEAYQSSFEYNATTTDFILTRMLYRLIIVLVMASKTSEEKKAKQRDMDALVTWIEKCIDHQQGFRWCNQTRFDRPPPHGILCVCVHTWRIAHRGTSTISLRGNGLWIITNRFTGSS